jgi:hypothetical protein
MNREFIPYEQALELKELGFDEKCLAYYWMNIDAIFRKPALLIEEPFDDEWCLPTSLYQQAFRWFREKYGLYAWIKVEYEYGGITPTYYITGKRQEDIAGGVFDIYEEAELACLKKLIELVKNK